MRYLVIGLLGLIASSSQATAQSIPGPGGVYTPGNFNPGYYPNPYATGQFFSGSGYVPNTFVRPYFAQPLFYRPQGANGTFANANPGYYYYNNIVYPNGYRQGYSGYYYR